MSAWTAEQWFEYVAAELPGATPDRIRAVASAGMLLDALADDERVVLQRPWCRACGDDRRREKPYDWQGQFGTCYCEADE